MGLVTFHVTGQLAAATPLATEMMRCARFGLDKEEKRMPDGGVPDTRTGIPRYDGLLPGDHFDKWGRIVDSTDHVHTPEGRTRWYPPTVIRPSDVVMLRGLETKCFNMRLQRSGR